MRAPSISTVAVAAMVLSACGAGPEQIEVTVDAEFVKPGEPVPLTLRNHSWVELPYDFCTATLESQRFDWTWGPSGCQDEGRFCLASLRVVGPGREVSGFADVPEACPEGNYRFVLMFGGHDRAEPFQVISPEFIVRELVEIEDGQD